MSGTPYKKKEDRAKQMQRYRLLQQLRILDNHFLMNDLADISEDKPLLVRVVGIDFKEASPKAVSKYTAHLSRFVINEAKYVEMLKTMEFPYKVELGDYYVIKRAAPEEVQKLLADRKASLQQLHDELKKVREG